MGKKKSALAQCCGFDSDSEEDDGAQFSAILSLDEYVIDWAYEKMVQHYERESTCLKKKRVPRRKTLNFQVLWDKVNFHYSKPKPITNEEVEDTAEPSNGNEETTPNANVAKYKVGDEVTFTKLPATGALDPRNKMEKPSLKQEIFNVKWDNTTNTECAAQLHADRTVKSIFEIDVHKSVQTNHSLKMSLKLGEPYDIGPEYEFNKMIDNYKGTKETSETETTLHTECPVTVPPLTRINARFVTSYENYKQTLEIESRFSGTLSVMITSKKKDKKSKAFYKLYTSTAKNIFEKVRENNALLQNQLKVEGQNVTFTSSATFCSNYGVDQHVQLVQEPLQKLTDK